MKKTLIFTGAIALLSIIGVLSIKILDTPREPDLETDSIEKVRLDKLVTILKKSTYFENSTFKNNETMDKLTVDDKYDISIKSGSYSMKIDDPKKEEGYCQIVDAVQQSLGKTAGKSIETCRRTLDGSIDMGGINAEIYDTHKILTVNSEETAKLYNIEASHEKDELIPTEEIDYDIKIDDYLFTSIHDKYSNEKSTHSICGNIYHPKNAKNTFLFTVYDEQKKELEKKTYEFQNDTKKFKTFCIDFTLKTNSVKYYSIGEN